MPKKITNNLCILGLGQIGGSVAKAAARSYEVIAYDQAPSANCGFPLAASPEDAVRNADLVIFASPLRTYGFLAQAIAPHLKKSALVMDVGSVKEAAIAMIAPSMPPGVHFIPAHPIAGSEKSGFANARADLFEGKQVILTPESPETPGVQEAIAFWQSLGSRVEAMPAELHDKIYAAVSHLPQLLAFAIKDVYQGTSYDTQNFQKFSRLWGSSPAMWQDIFDMNKENINNALKKYLEALNQIKLELEMGAEPAIETPDPALLYGRLLPRILSSCLISSVAREERATGIPFARFAGTGFADFTAPAQTDPEDDLMLISKYWKELAEKIEIFISIIE